MGKTSRFILQAKNQPKVCLVVDTVLTHDIVNVIKKFNPDYIVVNSAVAMIKSFSLISIILDEDQTIALIGESYKAKVIAFIMNSLYHCFITKSILNAKVKILEIPADKLIIPEDVEIIKL